MPFSSLLFVCAFLPLCVAATWLAPAKWRNVVLLAFSVAFYAWGAPRFLPIVLGLCVADFALARAIAGASGRSKRALVALGVCVHVSVLAYFKYANFFVDQLDGVRGALGLSAVHWVKVTLPIGVSFLTFEEMSYLIDVYRGDARPAQHPGHYALFLMLFPHSIAGPIFRWKDLASQFAARRIDAPGVLAGFARFSLGLSKKVLVADSAAWIADAIFSLSSAELSGSHAWIGATAYAIQIYFDFSGYSDMAIGLGKMFGFDFKENFDEPYVSASITEFWTRWHISLTSWMRDYLYIPLGGNRRGARRASINLLVVFAVSGFWHGAAWTFLAWGVYHGVLVAIERRNRDAIVRVPVPVRQVACFALVVIGWVPFRATSFRQCGAMIRAMFGASVESVEPRLLPAQMFPRLQTLVLCGALVYVLVRMFTIRKAPAGTPVRPFLWHPAASVAALVVSVMHMTNVRFTPLIYFKF